MSRKAESLTGQTFGQWTVGEETSGKGNGRYYKCVCTCGRSHPISDEGLRRGNAVRCTTCAWDLRRKVRPGMKFGLLLVESRASDDSRRRNQYNCICSCGRPRIVPASYLLAGSTDRCVTCTKQKKSDDQKENYDSVVGRVFKGWTVLSRDYHVKPSIKYAFRDVRYLCQCTCGHVQSLAYTTLLKPNRSFSCNSCARLSRKDRNVQKRKEFTGIPNFTWKSIVTCAKNRGIPLIITREDAFELYIKQNGLCALTGVPLKMEYLMSGASIKGNTASLDRINSDLGYTIDNIQWVHKIVNAIKMALPENELISWCKLLVKYNERRMFAKVTLSGDLSVCSNHLDGPQIIR